MRRECWERFPRHRLQRKPLVGDLDMHHGTCATRVPWCMSGSVIRGGGKNVPGIPDACATRNFTYLERGPCKKYFFEYAFFLCAFLVFVPSIDLCIILVVGLSFLTHYDCQSMSFNAHFQKHWLHEYIHIIVVDTNKPWYFLHGDMLINTNRKMKMLIVYVLLGSTQCVTRTWLFHMIITYILICIGIFNRHLYHRFPISPWINRFCVFDKIIIWIAA